MAKAASLAEARSHNVLPETFLRHYREIRDLKDAHAETGMAVARAKKAAKNDGIDLDALKWLEKLAGLDADEADMQIRHLQIYARWIELPIGTQLKMFAEPEPPPVKDEAAAEQREWVAGGRGFDAGEAGHQRDTNPFDAGTAEHVAWDKSWARGNKLWLKGQDKIAKEMGPKAGNGAAAPRKRSRPRSSEAQAAIL